MARRLAFVENWGSTAGERAEDFECDSLVGAPELELYRAVDVQASPATVFRWLCQLRVAPYSYDLLDNAGRRSPRRLTTGLDQLEVGQRFMRLFKLVAFEPGRSITLIGESRTFGRVAVTYRVLPAPAGGSRLLAKLLVGELSPGLSGRAVKLLLAPGDLVMMRRQLLNLKRLAEVQEAGAREL